MSAERDASTGLTVGVAFSGGRDSLALLHATAHAARAFDLQVVALHVHHGLLAQADGWVTSATDLCRRWRRRGLPVRLCWRRVEGKPQPGDSVEAWARRARYEALTAMARAEGASLIVLAQHRRDQAETVLLQALRGAGPRGLAAMPACVQRDGLTWVRPWLDQPREAIESYLQRYRLRAVEDPSNADARLARNRLRLRVWPVLRAAFADAETTLAAVARRAQEADAVLREVAQADLPQITAGDTLLIEPWLQLSAARRGNALRAWLAVRGGRGSPETLVQRLLAELPGARIGSWPAVDGGALQLHRGRLTWLPGAARAPIGHGPVETLDLSRPGQVRVASWSGSFVVTSVAAQGVEPSTLREVSLRPRGGGERFAHATRAHPQSLKKQFQAAGVPARERTGPLVWHEGALVFVPGLGIDARRWALPGRPQLSLRWQADAG